MASKGGSVLSRAGNEDSTGPELDWLGASADYLAPLCLSFPISKMGLIVLSR